MEQLYVLILAAALFVVGLLIALWSASRQLGLDAWREGINARILKSEERIESTVGRWRSSMGGGRPAKPGPDDDDDDDEPDARARAKQRIRRKFQRSLPFDS
jgi:hypothetical protein